jgi:DNA-binding transcriptional MerR regulator/effector-binding domain-containing protein
MLRHYDEIGLLAPARVDPFTGYRFYDGAQFAVLGRVLALKDLGFRLDEVTRIVHGEVDDSALHEMLIAQRAELSRQLDLDAARLRRLDAHIRHIEGEPVMSTITAELKALPSLHVAQASADIPGFGPENIGPIIGPLFGRLLDDLNSAGVRLSGEAIAMYEANESGDGEGARAHAAFAVGADATAGTGFEITDVPGVELAATTIHHGSMATIGDAWEALLAWINDNGYELAGVCRELYIVSEPEPQENWVTELQQPVVRA